MRCVSSWPTLQPHSVDADLVLPVVPLGHPQMTQDFRSRGRSSGPTLVVVTDDGTVLECTPHEVAGARTGVETRWVFVAPDGAEHVGPHYTGFTSVGDVRLLANRWWESRK